jgi:hypothetical protein
VVELCLRHLGAAGSIELVGRVVQASEHPAGGCEAAIRIIEIGTRDRERLIGVMEET